MAFKGITFAGQNVTPKNDGGLYQAHYGDGILWGCSMAISGDDLVIQSGEFIMGGRVVQVDGATNVDLSGRLLSSGYIQVIMNADLSQGEGLQWYTTFVESATTTFPALTQDDINDTGTLYQIALAVIQISGGNLTSIYSSLIYSPITTINNAYIDGDNNNANLWLMENSSSKGVLYYSDGGDCTYLHSLLNGNPQAGLLLPCTASPTIYFSDGQNIVFRPNGISNNNGQVSFTPAGQQIGGHPLNIATTTSSKSLQSGAYTEICHASIVSSGVYMVIGMVEVSLATAGQTATLALYGSSGTVIGDTMCDHYFNVAQSARRWQTSSIITGMSTVYFNIVAGANGTINWGKMYIVRLA